ncbi:amino-acid acetyltransferase [Striga asiatica]|uniref:Amino-acid acetyltransferase n=1 Tax=Striga asiatica TaxID=4170 RepID=A0A5A7Q3M3_STRAF|nr:amino-acid acetyltransferase [Striga asiatica]
MSPPAKTMFDQLAIYILFSTISEGCERRRWGWRQKLAAAEVRFETTEAGNWRVFWCICDSPTANERAREKGQGGCMMTVEEKVYGPRREWCRRAGEDLSCWMDDGGGGGRSWFTVDLGRETGGG